jgi:uncharacterized membrane protein YqaE (UPF0057 family)
MDPLKPILGPIKEMGNFFKELSKFFAKIFIILPKFISIFEMFTNPTKFIKDVLWGILEGSKAVFNALLGELTGNINKNRFTEGKSRVESCFSPSLTHIIILVLCPPLALTLHIGLKKFGIVLVSFFLTYFYYFPGLIYASLFIL